jgi:hypothetical protein
MTKQAQFLKKGDAFLYAQSKWVCGSDAYENKKGMWQVQLADDRRRGGSIIPTSEVFTFSKPSESMQIINRNN